MAPRQQRATKNRMIESAFELAAFLRGNALEGALSLVGLVATFFGFWCVGRFIRDDDAAIATLIGWSLITAASVLSSLVGVPDLRIVSAMFLCLAVASLVKKWPGLRPLPHTWMAMLLMAPMFLFGVGLPSLSWDSYSHWLLNAFYIFEHNHLLSVPLEQLPSMHPSYPPAIALPVYLTSRITARFAESSGHLLNVMLAFLALVHVLKILLHAHGIEAQSSWRWLLAATFCAFLIVVGLNPSMQWVDFWATLADPALAVVVLISVSLWSTYLSADVPDWKTSVAQRELRSTLVALFLLGSLICNIKQGGWLIALILTTSGTLIGLLRRMPVSRWLPPALALFAGALLTTVLWEHYLSTRLPVTDQFRINPLSQWRFDLLPDLISGFLRDFAAYWRYYLGVLAVVAAGVGALFTRKRATPAPLTFMCMFAALAMLAHLASLFAAYLGTGFLDWEIKRAHSLQRYSMQIGYTACVVGLTFVAAKALEVALRESPGARVRSSARLAAVPLALLVYGYFVVLPSASIGKYFSRTRAESRPLAVLALKQVAADSRTAVIGDEWSVNIANYVAWRSFSAADRPALVARDNIEERRDLPHAEASIAEWIEDPSIDSILMLNAVDLAIDLRLEHEPDYVWERDTGAWRPLKLDRSNRHELN